MNVLQQESLVPGDQVCLHPCTVAPLGNVRRCRKERLCCHSACVGPLALDPGMTPDVTTWRRQSLNVGF
ncbi:unnamed protein product [Boreogadus saida]